MARKHPSPAFSPGQTVRVRTLFPPGHVRTPYYCRGKRGVIERVIGPFANPEQLAYGQTDATALTLYRVRFEQRELWPDYAGPARDRLELELYEPWLEASA